MDDGAESADVAMHNRKPAPDRRSITAELVNEIADKVYAMLLRESRIEQECLHLSARRLARRGGGPTV